MARSAHAAPLGEVVPELRPSALVGGPGSPAPGSPAPGSPAPDDCDLDVLVAAARAGTSGAFDELVRRTYSETYRLALRLTGHEEDARDVVQEAYIRAYRGLRRFRGDARFSTWLYRITVNCSATSRGRRHRHRHVVLSDDQPVVDACVDRDPEARVNATLLRDRVREAVRLLPPKLKAVVVLRDVYDLSHQEIGQELGISESAAKVRLHRARKRLRAELFPGRDSGGLAVAG